MYQVVKKLKLLKKKLKVLKSYYSHDIVREAEEDRKLLKQSQLKLQRDPSNKEVQQAEFLGYQKFKQSSYLAEMYLQQRSKSTWIKLGDDNIQYFYSIIKHRKLKQATMQLKDDTGTWQTDPGTIANLFVDYYSELLGRKSTSRVQDFTSILKNGPTLSTAQHVELLMPVVDKEVKEAVLHIDSNKSPGPYDIGSGFYKVAWPIVGQEITEAVIEFFHNGKFLKQLKSTIIALIPVIV